MVAVVAVSITFGYWVRGGSAALPPPSSGPVAGEPSPSPGGVGLPIARLTPGAVNTAVTMTTLGTTICKSGWTATVRPPSAYTSALKLAQIVEYGYADRDPSHYEEDHLVPLEVGGAPRDPRNLWPEPWTASLVDGTPVGAGAKDGLEDYLKAQVCAGTMNLADAQRLIAGDWISAWDAAGRP